MCGTHEWKTQCRKSLNPILNPIKFNHPIHSFMVYIKNFMHVLYEDHSFSIVGLMWQNVCFPQDQFNFHSWVTAKFFRDITRLHTLNCYIRKQILYFARLIDEQRKVSSDSKSLNICFGRSRHAC